MGGISLPDILENGWLATKAFVLENPISAAVYDIALKIFGLYCQSYFYPVGISLAAYLITSSIVFDFAIFGQINDYKNNFFISFSSTKKRVWKKIKSTYTDNVSFYLQGLIGNFFSKSQNASHRN